MTGLERFVASAEDQWSALVNLCFQPHSLPREDWIARIAAEAKTTPESVSRKFRAIVHAREVGVSTEDIVQQGSTKTLSDYAKAKKKVSETYRVIKWRVPVSLADAVQAKVCSEGQEESLQARFMRVLGIRTSDAMWDFLLSCFSDLSDAELRHLAGLDREKKKCKVRSRM